MWELNLCFIICVSVVTKRFTLLFRCCTHLAIHSPPLCLLQLPTLYFVTNCFFQKDERTSGRKFLWPWSECSSVTPFSIPVCCTSWQIAFSRRTNVHRVVNFCGHEVSVVVSLFFHPCLLYFVSNCLCQKDEPTSGVKFSWPWNECSSVTFSQSFSVPLYSAKHNVLRLSSYMGDGCQYIEWQVWETADRGLSSSSASGQRDKNSSFLLKHRSVLLHSMLNFGLFLSDVLREAGRL